MLVEFGDTMPIARKEGPRFENHDLLEKSRVDSYLQRFLGLHYNTLSFKMNE
jgi:hypothetical protein